MTDLEETNTKMGVPMESPNKINWRAKAPLWLEVLAALTWLYILIKLFVIDIDNILITKLVPSAGWILYYKSIIFLGFLAFIFLFSKTIPTWKWFIYVLFFPFITIFWRIPTTLFFHGSLNFIFAFIYAVFFTLNNIKSIVYIVFCFALFACLCSATGMHIMNLLGATGMIGLLYACMALELKRQINISGTFDALNQQILNAQTEAVAKIAARPDIKSLALIHSSEENKPLISDLENALLLNRVLLIVAKQLRLYKARGFLAINSAFVTLKLFVISVIVFTFVYEALYSIDHNSMTFTREPSFFVFFAMSFKAMVFGEINGVSLVSITAQILNIMQNFTSLLILTFFASILLSAYLQQANEKFDRIIASSERESAKIEDVLFAHYGIDSMDSLLSELQRLKASTISILLYLTRRIGG